MIGSFVRGDRVDLGVWREAFELRRVPPPHPAATGGHLPPEGEGHGAPAGRASLRLAGGLVGAPKTFPHKGEGGPAKPGRMRVGEHWRRDWQLRPEGTGGTWAFGGRLSGWGGCTPHPAAFGGHLPPLGEGLLRPWRGAQACGLQGDGLPHQRARWFAMTGLEVRRV